MRLDKYLKVAKILKRRTISNAVARQEKILVNNKVAKPATTVKIGDLITINFGSRLLRVKVLSTMLAKSQSDTLMYEVVEASGGQERE